jgi:hypothetical protein
MILQRRFHSGASIAIRHPSDQQVGGRLDDCGKPLGRSGFDPNVSRLCDGGQSRNQTPVHEDHRVAPVRSCSHVISVRLSLPVDRADQHISEDAPVLGG